MKIKLIKIKDLLVKLPRILGEKAFLTFLGLLIIFLIFGAFLFYKYIFLVERIQPEAVDSYLQFDENLFQKISKKFNERERNFKITETKEYPDPFIRIAPIEEAPEDEEEVSP